MDNTELRNHNIYRLVSEGVPISKVSKQFNISSNRVRQIINKLDTKCKNQDNKLYKIIELSGNDLYVKPNVIEMTFQRINRYGVHDINDLLALDISDYQDQWYVGPVQLSIIVNAQKLARL